MSEIVKITTDSEAATRARLLVGWSDRANLREGLTPKQARERDIALADGVYAERVTKQPPDQVTWRDLGKLMALNPTQGVASWEAIKLAARQGWETSHRSASAFKLVTSPWERAQSLGIRSSFIAVWRPANQLEGSIIETMAQAPAIRMFWFERLGIQSMREAHEQDEPLKAAKYLRPPRISTAQSLTLCAEIVERFDRLFHRGVRSLRDLRRWSTPVTINNPGGQLNIGTHVNSAQVDARRDD